MIIYLLESFTSIGLYLSLCGLINIPSEASVLVVIIIGLVDMILVLQVSTFQVGSKICHFDAD